MRRAFAINAGRVQISGDYEKQELVWLKANRGFVVGWVTFKICPKVREIPCGTS